MPDKRNTVISIIEQGTPVELRDVLLLDHCRVLYAEYPPGATPLPPGLRGTATTPPVLTCEVTLDLVDGVLTPTEFAVIGSRERPVTARDLRGVRFQEVVDAVVTSIAAILERQRGRAPALVSDAQHDAIGHKAIGHRRLTTSLLRQVAELAQANPDQPTKQVSEQMYTSHRNATRWIAEARRRGFFDRMTEGELE